MFSYNSAFATTCTTWTRLSDKKHSEKLREIDAIFYGEIIAINKPSQSSENNIDFTQILQVKVLRVWKGVEEKEVFVKYIRFYWFTEMDKSDIGKKEMFYAYKLKDDSSLMINSCSLGAFDDERMMREYGEGKIIEQPQPIETTEGFFAWLWRKITSFFS